MPGPISSADPSLNRPFGSVSPEALTTRSISDREPLGPDRLYNLVVGRPVGSEAILGLKLHDTPFTAALGSVADQQPSVITKAIRYDPSTGGYSVRLHDRFGRPVDIPVSRAEIADNIRRGGAGTSDDLNPSVGLDPVRDAGIIWPSVIETAYAKMQDSNWSDGLSQGYAAIQKESTPDAALLALTGKGTAHIGYVPIPLESKGASLDLLGGTLSEALAGGSPVVINTSPERRSLIDVLLGRPGAQDGLADNQSLVVTGVYKDERGVWQVKVYSQGPIGDANDNGSFGATIPLEKLVDTGGLKDFTIGAPPGTITGGLFPYPDGHGPIGTFPGGGIPDDPGSRV